MPWTGHGTREGGSGNQTQQQGSHRQARKDTHRAPLLAIAYLHHRLQIITENIFFKLILHEGFQLNPCIFIKSDAIRIQHQDGPQWSGIFKSKNYAKLCL